MYTDLPLWLAIVFLVGGLYLVAKSANVFIDSAGTVATALGVNPFIIGMVVIGFGTSAPELCVSALSGLSGHSDVSLGNAYGSCSFNIALILGLAAMIRPISVKPTVSFVAVPVLLGITAFSCFLVGQGHGFSRADGLLELGVFAVILPVYCWFDQKMKSVEGKENSEKEKERGKNEQGRGLGKASLMLVVGLAGLVGSSHILVWGAVGIARSFGVSELLIGLTIVAAGTSLPELASAVASARRGQNELTLGNIIGSNFFNALAVVGTSGTISPFKDVSPLVLMRDLPVMAILTLSIGLFGCNFRNPRSRGALTRTCGIIWLAAFACYLAVVVRQEAFAR